MRKIIPFLITLFSFGMPLIAEVKIVDEEAIPSSNTNTETPVKKEAPPLPVKPPQPPFKAFTGKVSRNKVRLRVQPTLDGAIVRELNKGDMIVVVGETEDYYAVQPPTDLKGYIYRTLVLDNVVEGSNVNVRLEPSLDSPIIAQLNGGDRVDGRISGQNNKWMEIVPPTSTRFFVSKDFIEKAGDANLLATINRRKNDVNILLQQTSNNAEEQLNKPFEQIQIEPVIAGFRKIIDSYSEFPEQVSQAKERLTQTQEDYLKKKVAYLEDQNRMKADSLRANANRVKEQSRPQPVYPPEPVEQPVAKPIEKQITAKMAAWEPSEDKLYQAWCRQRGYCSRDDYYSAQAAEAIALKGVIEPYNRPVKNKPGDYVLVNSGHLPIAYLYSSFVNLQDYVGQEVTVQATPRPNNQFAFPAYFVLDLD
ncbi:MAG: hypothetical protein WC222_01230 [Parachlamydiales bacterium]|jgi:uncharacterized protein YgiM (DUF1202 family)